MFKRVMLDLPGDCIVDMHTPSAFWTARRVAATRQDSAEAHCGSAVWVLYISKGGLVESGQR